MTNTSVINNPDFFRGFIRHLQRLQREFSREGEKEKAAETSTIVRVMQMMLTEMVDTTPLPGMN
jgi:hypothetical protein